MLELKLSLCDAFFDMIGVRTPDNAVFLADCVSGENTLNKFNLEVSIWLLKK